MNLLFYIAIDIAIKNDIGFGLWDRVVALVEVWVIYIFKNFQLISIKVLKTVSI